MNKLDRELYDMTALAKPELERYNRQRVLAYQSSLIDMVESEVKIVSSRSFTTCAQNVPRLTR